MKTNKRTERLHLRIDPDVITWLKRAAAKKRTTLSEMARQELYAAFERRHAK
jgi:uncharacterized protein (DUF1778 family)